MDTASSPLVTRKALQQSCQHAEDGDSITEEQRRKLAKAAIKARQVRAAPEKSEAEMLRQAESEAAAAARARERVAYESKSMFQP
jgi:hypothetical protein